MDYIFTNTEGTFRKEYKTDRSPNFDNFNVVDFSVSGSISEADLVTFGINFRLLEYTYAGFKAFAATNNLTLIEIDNNARTSTTLNTATDISIATTSITGGNAGVAEVTTATIPATSGATQGDYMILNNKAGVSFAVWLDIDGAGTEPSGALYVATDYQIEVNIATAGSAITNGGLVKAAIELDTNWTGFETITDNGDGTLTITNSDKGIVTTATVHNAAESGAGSIGVTEATAGSGDYSFQLVKAGGIDPCTWALNTGSPALVDGLVISSTGEISGVATTTGAPDCVFLVTDRFGQTATKELTVTIS